MDEVTRKLMEEKARRLAEMPHKYYVPTGAGEEFINKLGSGKYFVTLFSAANGVGKTWIGANTLANLFWPCGNEWYDRLPLFKEWPFPKKARIISDPNTIKETIIPNLKAVFPKGRYTAEKGGKSFESHWTTDTGWEFTLMTYDQDPKEFESATLGLVWCDEPPPEIIYKANVSRLRRGGLLFITATPLTGSAWMYDHIICNVNHEQGDRTFVNADVESACKEHGVRGFLNHKDIERMTSEYSEDEKAARMQGKFQHLVGLVYKQWSRNIHVIKPFNVDKSKFTVLSMLDPHPRTPDAALWLAVDKLGRKFIVDELYTKVDSTEELAQRIKQKDEKFHVIRHYGDPAMFASNQHNPEQCLANELQKYGLSYIPAPKRREDANKRLGDALNYVKVGDDVLKSPEIYVFDTCMRFIYEVEHWRWDEWRGKSRDDHGQKEKPIDKDDHMIENVGRALLLNPTFVPYEDNSYSIDNFTERYSGGIIRDNNLDPY
jgi:phage terminase large subunit-like protein